MIQWFDALLTKYLKILNSKACKCCAGIKYTNNHADVEIEPPKHPHVCEPAAYHAIIVRLKILDEAILVAEGPYGVYAIQAGTQVSEDGTMC